MTAETGMAGEVPQPARPTLERGVLVGRYVILGWLGAGGMGVVYKAYDPELERAVALKLLHTAGAPDASSATSRRDRLFREAKALARLSHPHVLAIFDVGTFEADVFLATEFVEGPTLAAWLKDEGGRARAEILSAFLDAGEGLAAAHQAGLVHRDFKPANVLVGKDGRVRVLDFGLARAETNDPAPPPTPMRTSGALPAGAGIRSSARTAAAHARSPSSLTTVPASPRALSAPPPASPPAAPSSANLRTPSAGLLELTITQEGQIIGTPRFMAPEQHRGQLADGRSDQFSFCVSLYDALYGEFPFEGRGEEYAANVVNGRVRSAPSGSDVPRWLRAILVRGLSATPGDRFASMDELLAALRSDPRVARNRWLAFGAGIALLLGAGLTLRLSRPAVESPCRGAERKLAGVWDEPRKGAMRAAFLATGVAGAEETFARAKGGLDEYAQGWVGMHTDACEATHVRGEQSAEMLDLRVECLSGRLEELRAQVDVFTHGGEETVKKSVQAARALPRLQACADAAALRAPIRPPSDEPTRTRVEALRTALAKAKAEQRAGNYAGALAIATKAADDATALAYRPIEAEALYVLGDVEDDQGDYATAEATLRRSFGAALAGRHEAQAARALTALVAEVGLRQARFAEGHQWAALAEAEVERSSDPFIRGELPRNEGRLFVREEKYPEARGAIEKCLSIWEPALAKDDYAIAGPVTDLGNVFFLQGDLDAASAEYTRSLAILEHTLGPSSPSLAPNLNNLGEIALDRGDYEVAARSLDRARGLWENALGPDHPKVALVLANLTRSKLAEGDTAGALAMAERALAIWRKALPAEHPDVALGMHGVAEALRAKEDYAGALAMEEAALAMREKIYGKAGYALAESLVSIAETRLAEGAAVATAAAPLERALAILQSRRTSAVELAQARFDLARALALSDPPRSRALATEAREGYAQTRTPLAVKRGAEIDAWLARGPH
jgi:serine/threonine protein kinase/tetratricopeptide (TPR) repeat protein